jgi:3-deoxy-manno-octulosonate cytidylyltransferase (CMP-KDO synthetase)
VTRAIGIVPARWASTRFPGKILHPVCGRPLLHWVLARARRARRLAEVIVATDDERIRAAAKTAGVEAVLTDPAHASGTDRVAEAARGRRADVVVNIQGDEPLLDPELVDALVDALADGRWDMATAACPLAEEATARRPSVVKVVCAADGTALYFSRALIPFFRDRAPDAPFPPDIYLRHIGLYAYRGSFLKRFTATPPSRLEQIEKLEQLRALEMGSRILVRMAREAGVGVDTPEDVPAAEAALRAAGEV